MQYCIFDIESDNLLDKVTKIHCLSYRIYENKTILSEGSITNYNEIINFINNQELLVGHNIVLYDIPVLEKILNIEVKSKLIDTLAISWSQYPISKFKHGLAHWGEKLGYGKPPIQDWENQPIEVYIHRCESDVEINSRLFHHQMDYSMDIYGDINEVQRFYAYLSFKMDCLKDQQDSGIDLDVRLAEKSKFDLEFIIQEKLDNLSSNMPKRLGKLIKNKPKVIYKKDGELSAHGINWFEHLKQHNLPLDTEELREIPNPGSTKQLKEWLYSLGWKPQTFKVSKSTGEELSQVSLPFGAGLCPSVKELFESFPYLEALNDLYKAKHRYGIFKSFLENKDENNKIYASAKGLTNTLRFSHSKPCVNLPGVDKWYGKEIRGCLKVPNDDYLMCGSDVSGLEDGTKRHYMYFFDPEYVKEMQVPGFDPHIDIGVFAGLITKEEEKFFKWYKKQEDDYLFTQEEKDKMYSISRKRSSAKTVNFGGVYGIGADKLSKQLKIPLSEAKELHKLYWERNKAVKQTEKACIVKTILSKYWITENGTYKEVERNQKWLYNPISGFWVFLKADKDKFSSLNQNSGVYFFDMWLRNVRIMLKPLGIKVFMQMHDELAFIFKKELKPQITKIVREAMKKTNEECKLNVELGCSIEYGLNYSDCH